MSADDLDEVMRRLVPPVEVAPDRAARVMETVMARLDERSRVTDFRAQWADWLAHLLSVSRFALPMAAAALLGLVVGRDLRPAGDMVAFDQVFTATYFAGLSY